MWLYTRYGIFSIVRNNETGNFKVRSRWPEHLDMLKELTGITAEIILTEGRDYPARIIVSDEDYWLIMQELTASVDYDNFKDQIGKDGVLGGIDGTMDAIYGAYNSCWDGGRDARRALFPSNDRSYHDMTDEEWQLMFDEPTVT